ncbi:ABC transporter substrate-binding protein [Streptosporangiaceae bacterium NEAU-GS5]|nr:ABC transporter substrate-binding protein [Streptosporangiaceae bacterium NEAU-GS5]
MRWHIRLVATGAVAAVALTSACSGGKVRGAASPQASSGKTVDSTFVYVPNLDVVTDWDPASSYSNEIIAMENIYESLTRYNPQTKQTEPRLATAWTKSSDGKQWTFTLRGGVTFHTGKPVDAAAAKESIERTMKTGAGAAYIWGAVDKIEAKDPTTLVFTLKYPVPLDLIASAGYAAYIYDASVDFKAGTTDGGSGPYTIESWRKGQETELTLKAYDKYWGGWAGPHYTKIAYRVTPELTTAWQLLQRGEVSFVERLNPQLFAQAASTPSVQASQSPSFQNLLVLFNTGTVDVKVRKAIQKAIDYDGLVAALKGAGVPASGLVPEGLLGYTPELRPRQDLAGAESLLKEAGYGPDGKKLTLSLTYAQGDSDQEVLVTLLTSALDKLNVKLEAKPLQWTTQWDQGKGKSDKRQDIFIMYWYPDYADAFSWFVNVFRSADPVSFNLSYLKDAAIDKEIDGLPELSATDTTKAQDAYGTLQREIIDDQAAVAVPYVQNYQRALSSKVQGYVDNPAYPNVVFVYDLKPAA